MTGPADDFRLCTQAGMTIKKKKKKRQVVSDSHKTEQQVKKRILVADRKADDREREREKVS